MDDLRYQVDLLAAKNQKLELNVKMYEKILGAQGAAFLYLNLSNGNASTLGGWSNFFDFNVNESKDIGRILDAVSESDQGELRRLLYIEKEGRSEASLEVNLKDSSNYINVSVYVFFDSANNPCEKLFVISDVTKEKMRKDELEFMAYYDYLTNLYNRNYFISRLSEFVEKAKKENTVVSVMLLDIDDFHKVSDSRGLVAGDEIIQNLGLFIHDITETNVIASRFNSDIFCIAIYDPCGHRSVDTIYRTIKEFLSHPIRLTDMSDVTISVSAGVAEYPESADNAIALINSAEIVMLKAKKHGKNNIKFFDTSILRNFLNEVDLENKLREAILSNQFYLNYQPQYTAEGNRLRGVEALIRWKDKDGAMISPGVFIPVAENNGCINQIGDYVLEASIMQYSEWKKRFDIDFVLSVNISSVQFNRNSFVSRVMNTISKYNMDPEKLEIEITESVLIDDFDMVISKIEELRDFGVKVSLDDFGTGFSSLAYLKGLPVNTLKIDKSFIDNVTNDDSSKVIVETIMSLAKRLGFTTVAEGVETKEQLDYLSSIHCDLIQGYYLSKPVSKEDIDQLLLRM